MRKKKYLPLYYRWMKKGRLPIYTGLCGFFMFRTFDTDAMNLLKLFKPSQKERQKYHLTEWWGGGEGDPQKGEMTPMRQNVLLFMAALNEEL